jgi:hypothetical protein
MIILHASFVDTFLVPVAQALTNTISSRRGGTRSRTYEFSPAWREEFSNFGTPNRREDERTSSKELADEAVSSVLRGVKPYPS